MKKTDAKSFCFEKGHSKFEAIKCYDREDLHLKIKFKSLVRIMSRKVLQEEVRKIDKH